MCRDLMLHIGGYLYSQIINLWLTLLLLPHVAECMINKYKLIMFEQISMAFPGTLTHSCMRPIGVFLCVTQQIENVC